MSSNPIPQDPRGPRAFFGRRSGKRLHRGQQELFDTLLPELTIDISQPFDPREEYPDAQEIHLEIGYGGGEHLARISQENPQNGYIGCEVFTGGIGKLLEMIDEREIGNIVLFPDDVIKLLSVMPDACLDMVYLMYPDPWPKSRHHKRRFVQPHTLKELARVLKPGGKFRFASDIEDYADWTMAHILNAPEFNWPIQDPAAWHIPYAGWKPTRYEAKARREDRNKSWYLEFTRV